MTINDLRDDQLRTLRAATDDKLNEFVEDYCPYLKGPAMTRLKLLVSGHTKEVVKVMESFR